MTQPYEQPREWGDRATDYEDHFVPLSAQVAREVVKRIALGPGDRFLDVAAGTGAVSLAAARVGAQVVAVDFSPGMLSLLAEKHARLGLEVPESHVMDAERLAFEDAAFDAGGSSFGLIFCHDPRRALAELARVVRPGGAVFVTSVGTGSPLMQRIVGALMAVDPGFRPAVGLHPVARADVEGLGSMAREAGLREVRVESISVPWPVADPRRFWERWALDAPPVVGALRELPEAMRAAAGEVFVKRIAEEFGSETPVFPIEVLVGLGRA